MRCFLLQSAGLGLLAATAAAQVPTLQGMMPARHSVAGSRTAPISLTFSQPVANPALIRVAGDLDGQRTGTVSGAGTTQVSYAAGRPLRPGERVSVTVPAGVCRPAQVREFRVAAARATATFGAPVTVGPPPSTQPSPVLAGDLDHDGDLDLVALEAGGVVVCLNSGSGQFAAQPSLTPALGRTSRARLADFNGDGHLDLLTAGQDGSAGVYLGLGNGQGSFAPRTLLLTPTFSSSLATGDFNADGLADIVVATPGGTGVLLQLLPGTASGTPAIAATSAAVIAARDIGAADMDEDGDLDLVLASDSQAQVYLNNGAGSFTAAPGNPASINPLSGRLTVGDFTGDGHADVVCSSGMSPSVSLVPGTGTGGLLAAQSVTALSYTSHVSSGDMDGDGDLDLLVTNDRGITQVLLNSGSGQFGTASAFLIAVMQFTMAEAADLNGDGALDVYTGHGTSNPANPYGVVIFFNQPVPLASAAASAAQPVSVAPNPAHEQALVQVPAGSQPLGLELYDALGRLVRTAPGVAAGPGGSLPLAVAGLPAGLYVVRLRLAGGTRTCRLEVQ